MKYDLTTLPQGFQFRNHITGTSMEPEYANGSIVTFEVIRIDTQMPKVGRDYFVVRSDQKGTFKRLIGMTKRVLIFRALNCKAHPDLQRMKVEKSLVVFLAMAVGKYHPIP